MSKEGYPLCIRWKISNRWPCGQVMLEVIAAVAVVSVSLTVILSSLVGSYKAAVLAQEYIRALFLLEDRVGSVFLSADPGSEAPCSARSNAYLCKSEVTSHSTGSDSELREANLSVSWDAGKRTRKVTAATFIAGDQK